MVAGATTIPINTLQPQFQETFAATNWEVGNTGITKRHDYNQDFQMIYRVVDLTQRLLATSSCLVQNNSQTLENIGGRDVAMGSPQCMFDPDPAPSRLTTVQNKLSVFSSLPSVLAARKENDSLNIAYDCEYQTIDEFGQPNPEGKIRIIISYQFALYLNEDEILEVVFITRNPTPDNRLSYRTCLSSILDLLIGDFGFSWMSIMYKDTRCEQVTERRLYFAGSDDSYVSKQVFQSEAEASDYVSQLNPLIVIDCSNKKINDFKESRKEAFDVTFVCHSGIVDMSAFKNDSYGIGRNGSILPVFKSIQGGLVTMEPIFTHIPTAKQYWKFYPVNINFRDTMCYAPADSKSLSALGKSIDVKKIELPAGVISNMLPYLQSNPLDFIAYAAQDALVTIMYGSRLWGINKQWCLTSTSGSAFAMKQSIMKYYGIDSRDKNAKAKFERSYRGMHSVPKGKIKTPSGLRPISKLEAINPDAEFLHNFSANSYCGGYNTCITSGVFRNTKTYDFDLENAYPTAMCLVMDIDFDSDNPIERDFKNEYLTLQAFHTPVDPMFCYVDFEFPKGVKFPCIAIHDGGSIIFPRKAEGVYVSGPSLYLALKLGAEIFVRRGYVARIKLTQNLQPFMSLRKACKQMVQDRKLAKQVYGKGSIEELLLKLFVNGSYGKISQNVIEKNTWDGWNEYMTDIGFSSITSPERAALITDIVRCMLIGTLNQLNNQGIKSYSVTTDGFITEATLDELNACDAYGFKNLFEQSRVFLTDGDPTVWAVKHEQTELVNPTTRCNTGFGVDKIKDDGLVIPSGLGVLAHGGYISNAKEKDTYEDRFLTTQTILTRTGRVECVTKNQFKNLKDLVLLKIDFYTEDETRTIRLDFDMKRKPIEASFEYVSGNLEGIDYEYANFDTEPFEDLDEYHLYRNANEAFECLRTKEDWDRFFLKVNDRANGYKRVTKDMEWSKLFSVVQGYRSGLWDLPDVTTAESVAEKINVINSHNHSNKQFNENAWKNSRKPERASQMLPQNLIQDLLDEFNYIQK